MNFTIPFTFSIAPQVIFGQGASQQIGDKCKELGAQKVLIVTDKGIIQSALDKKLAPHLEKAGIKYSLFDEVEPNPTSASIEKGGELCRQEKFDLLIALGGGSSIDTAKSISILSANSGALKDYAFKGTVDPSIKKGIPIIALPTTAGTGSEVTAGAVVKDIETKRKYLVTSLYTRATFSILDPLLTLTMPPRITAATGTDALTHALGSLTNAQFHPLAELLDLEAIGLIAENLPKAVARGNHVEARTHMQYASLLAGLGLTWKSFDITHVMSTPLEGLFNLTHGEALGVLLIPCLEFNMIACLDKYVRIGRVLGLSVDGLPTRKVAQLVIDFIRQLLRDIGCPRSLKELGVPEDQIPKVVDMIKAHPALTNVNARSPVSEKDLGNLYLRAYSGE
jgi:alcohol dehydrogenase class IV